MVRSSEKRSNAAFPSISYSSVEKETVKKQASYRTMPLIPVMESNPAVRYGFRHPISMVFSVVQGKGI